MTRKRPTRIKMTCTLCGEVVQSIKLRYAHFNTCKAKGGTAKKKRR